MPVLSFVFLQRNVADDLVTDTTLGSWSSWRIIGQFFYLIIIFGAVVLLAYYATKWIAKAKQIKSGNANIRVIDSLALGQQSSVYLLQAGGQYILIGVTKEQVTYLTDVDPDELEFKPETTAEYMTLQKLLSQMMPKKKDREE